MENDKLASHVAGLVDVCKSKLDEGAKERERANDYANGKTPDVPARENRSSVSSRDVRTVMKKIMPSVMRTIIGTDAMVKYLPVGQDDEEGAEQATDYVNHVVIPEGDVEAAIHDAVHDAMLLKTGILKWSAYKETKVEVQEYTDQPDEAVVGLLGEPDVEIIDHETSEETDPDVLELNPSSLRHSFKIKRKTETITPKLEAVPRGVFLISPDAEDIETAALVGEIQQPTRSDLVSMGYDRRLVSRLESVDGVEYDDDKESREGDDYSDLQMDSREAMQEVEVYEVYVRLDLDKDGIAELHRIVYGETGSETEKYLILAQEMVTDAPYAAIVIERDPHQFDGHSLYEETADIQRVKTMLMRATLDNLYAQNNQRPAVQRSALEDEEDLINFEFGQPIYLKPGHTAREALEWQQVPFVAGESFSMLQYMDQVATDRTGVTDASGGLDAEAFVNTSATAAHIASEAGVAQADAIVRSIARGGLRKAFRGLLKLVIAHADGPRTVQIRGEWKSYDPSVWNVDMDCTVNVGLGGGTKERDLSVLQVVLGLQKELLASLGPDNVYVKPDQLYNTLEKIVETAGFPSALPFFTKPDPEEVKQKFEAAAKQPNPDEQKLQAQMQLEKAKMEAARDKEMAQMEADLQVKSAEMEKDAIARREQLQADQIKEEQRLAFERERLAQERDIKMADIQAKLAIAGARNV